MLTQPVLFDAPEVSAPPGAVQCVPQDAKSRGAVFTKPDVVCFMLDLAGYTSDKELWTQRLLEPACGSGRFLIAAARRLVDSWVRSGQPDTVLDLAVRAVEVDRETAEATRRALMVALVSGGLQVSSARRIVASWLLCDDFLTADIDGQFDFVIGNPPYVRQELVPAQRLLTYRRLFPTMVGRADLYVGFFDKSLGLLAAGGKTCLICADAWTRNDYGRELRRLVTQQFALRVYVDMYGLDVFENDVGTYPSITVIERGLAGDVRVGVPASTSPAELSELSAALTDASRMAKTVPAPTSGDGPWLLRGDDRQGVVRALESRLPTLEQAACRVGIGVASGADAVFVGLYDELPVEASRKLPLAVSKDLIGGQLCWHGLGVVNPWADEGGLVDLHQFPQLATYLGQYRDRLAGRHTAKADPASRWYKTIDKITPALTWQPKLFVPDIRGDGDAIAYDSGRLYPHHNLYYITSDVWDLRALQALLRSGMARLFVDAYAVKIGGGYLRFQAQYLRRIRIPAWASIDRPVREELANAGALGVKVPPSLLESVCGLDVGSLAFMKDWQ